MSLVFASGPALLGRMLGIRFPSAAASSLIPDSCGAYLQGPVDPAGGVLPLPFPITGNTAGQSSYALYGHESKGQDKIVNDLNNNAPGATRFKLGVVIGGTITGNTAATGPVAPLLGNTAGSTSSISLQWKNDANGLGPKAPQLGVAEKGITTASIAKGFITAGGAPDRFGAQVGPIDAGNSGTGPGPVAGVPGPTGSASFGLYVPPTAVSGTFKLSMKFPKFAPPLVSGLTFHSGNINVVGISAATISASLNAPAAPGPGDGGGFGNLGGGVSVANGPRPGTYVIGFASSALANYPVPALRALHAEQTGALATTMADDGAPWVNAWRNGGVDAGLATIQDFGNGVFTARGQLSSGPIPTVGNRNTGKWYATPDTQMLLVNYPASLVAAAAPLLGSSDPLVGVGTSALAAMSGVSLAATNETCGLGGMVAVLCVTDDSQLPPSYAALCPLLLVGASQSINFPAADAAAGTVDRTWPTGDFNVAAAANDSDSPPAAFPASNNPALNVTFTSATPSVCTVAGVPGPNSARIHAVVAGICTITAHSAAVPGIAVAPDVSRNIKLGESQVISFPDDEPLAGTVDLPWGTGDFDVHAAANSSASAPAVFPASNDPALNVTFISATPAVCTVVGVPGPNSATIHPESAGTCTITAQSAAIVGTSAAADVTSDIQLGATQVINFPDNEPLAGTVDLPWGTGDFDVHAAANSSSSPPAVFPASNDPALNVTFISATPSVCTVVGVPGPNSATVHPVAAGTCAITAQSAAIVGTTAADDVSAGFIIGDHQVINFPADSAAAGTSAYTMGGGDFDVRAAANGSASPPAAFPASNDPNLNVTFGSLTPAKCTIAAVPGPNTATIHPVARGTCAIVAQSAAVLGTFAAADVINFITFDETQTISFPSNSAAAGTDDHAVGGDDFEVFAAANGSASAPAAFPISNDGILSSNVTFSSSTPATCTIVLQSGANSATVHPESAGTCTITAQSGPIDGITAATDVSVDITITP